MAVGMVDEACVGASAEIFVLDLRHCATGKIVNAVRARGNLQHIKLGYWITKRFMYITVNAHLALGYYM